ncbi:hypothetical protein [Pseudorhodoplanes sp.]|uniref:hypothetical protein n=1 Tax=Pseudorhodoplanes sp. TaxID=1934341 RepID=UPI00391C12FE
MVPGGVTETIWHFVGYFQHIDDVMKNRLTYEHGGINLRPQAYTLELKDFLSSHDLDELDTKKIPFDLPAPIDAIKDPAIPRDPAAALPEFEDIEFYGARSGRLLPPKLDLPILLTPGTVGADLPNIKLTYSAAGAQQQLNVHQVNSMMDDDRVVITEGTGVEHLHDLDIEAAIQRLVTDARAEVPADLTPADLGTNALASFVVARDAAMAEDSGAGPHSVTPGYYVNGELAERPADDSAEPVAEPEPEAKRDTASKGQWATLGENQAANAAVIVDLKEGSVATLVFGDFYKTNVIVQTNAFIDNDSIEVSAPGLDTVAGGGTTSDNIADFNQLGGPYAGIPALFAGYLWNVEIVDGDFYDVNVIVQENVLRDNDVAVQTTNITHYQLQTGANQQANLTKVIDTDIKYDLIIIGGDYHGDNWIFQHNIILDSDILKIGAAGDAASVTSQAVEAGANELLNSANIISYGDNTFAEPTEDMLRVVDALDARETVLDPSYGWFVPGNGSGLLNVLYVTGSYYDINAIWQINVISDVDTLVQYLGKTPPKSLNPDGTLTQSASTGGNTAINEAVIVDVGSTFTFLGGTAYQDTILIQANLIGENNDKIVVGDPSTLVPEIVAFTGETVPAEDVTEIKAPVVPDDMIGSILT